MSIETLSQFYFGHTVDELNNRIDFDEGAGELTAILNSGSYSLTDYATEIARAMTDAGTQEYSASIDRTSRKITISATSNFDLLVSTGTHVGTSAFSLIGFTGSDQTGSNSYEGDSASGDLFRPQFLLQKYVPSDKLQRKASATVNQSASGKVETVSFGTVKFIEFNIPFITDIDQGSNGAIETNLTGVSDALNFLQKITNKGDFEFMPDRDTPSLFEKVLLESTDESQDGTGYRLREMTTRGIAGYYETGKIILRVV